MGKDTLTKYIIIIKNGLIYKGNLFTPRQTYLNFEHAPRKLKDSSFLLD